MITNVYSIYDVKAGVYNHPFYLVNDMVAERAFMDLITDMTTDVGKHPEDFSFYNLGTYNDIACLFMLKDQPELLYKGNELKHKILTAQQDFTTQETK